MSSPPANLDETDLRVIGCLQEDGRRSTLGIARELGLPEATVRRRSERLLRGGFIEVVAAANREKLGLPVHVIMGLAIDISRGTEVIAEVARLEETGWVAATTGPYDVMLEACFRDTRHLHAFVTGRLAQIAGVERVASAIVLDLAKHGFDWRRLMSGAEHDGGGTASVPDDRTILVHPHTNPGEPAPAGPSRRAAGGVDAGHP